MSVTETNEKKDIVKYRNEFNLTDLNSLDKKEQDILFTICSRFTTLKKEQILMTFDELREKAFLSERSYDYGENIKKLQSLGQKITTIKFTVTNGDDVKTMALFPTLSANIGTKEIFVRINPDFVTYLYDIPEKIGFSLYELKQFVYLKSKYSKTLFRFFMQNFSGKWTISIDKLREILGFPSSYTPGKAIQRIKNILPELENTGYFSDIEMDYTTSNKQGRPIKDIIFSYKINKEKALEAQGQQKLDYELATEEVVKVNHVLGVDENLNFSSKIEKHTETKVLNCPRCGGSLITKTKKDGGKYHCCTNSRYWKLGSADCEFYEEIEST